MYVEKIIQLRGNDVKKLESCWLRRKFDFPQVSILKNVPKKFGQNLTLMTEKKKFPCPQKCFPHPNVLLSFEVERT